MSCVIKRKHPILDAITNLGAEKYRLHIKIMTYIHASYGDCLADEFIDVKLKDVDKASAVSSIKAAYAKSSIELSVQSEEEIDTWIHITLESMFGFEAIKPGIDEKIHPVFSHGFLGKLRKGKNTVKIDCVVYQTDEDLGVFSTLSNRLAGRYHLDSTVKLRGDDEIIGTSMFYLIAK